MTAERLGVEHLTPTIGNPVRALCGECHEWVNANIEGPTHRLVAPLVFAQACEYSSKDAALLATWVGYNTMIQWLHTQASFSGFTPEDFRTVRETLAPPESHTIWIGARQWSQTGSAEAVEPWGFRPSAPGVVGATCQLAFVYLTTPDEPEAPWHEGEALGALVRLWPDPHAFRWAPQRILDREDYQRLKQGLHPPPEE